MCPSTWPLSSHLKLKDSTLGILHSLRMPSSDFALLEGEYREKTKKSLQLIIIIATALAILLMTSAALMADSKTRISNTIQPQEKSSGTENEAETLQPPPRPESGAQVNTTTQSQVNENSPLHRIIESPPGVQGENKKESSDLIENTDTSTDKQITSQDAMVEQVQVPLDDVEEEEEVSVDE